MPKSPSHASIIKVLAIELGDTRVLPKKRKKNPHIAKDKYSKTGKLLPELKIKMNEGSIIYLAAQAATLPTHKGTRNLIRERFLEDIDRYSKNAKSIIKYFLGLKVKLTQGETAFAERYKKLAIDNAKAQEEAAKQPRPTPTYRAFYRDGDDY